MRDAEAIIGSLADERTVAFIGAVDEEGLLVVKATPASQKREGTRVFYLTTNTLFRHTTQYRESPRACVYFRDRCFFRGAMLKKTMEILEGSEGKEVVWREGDTMYCPGGIADPDYCMMRFTATSERFYSNFHSKGSEVQAESMLCYRYAIRHLWGGVRDLGEAWSLSASAGQRPFFDQRDRSQTQWADR